MSALQELIESVTVKSLANGDLLVTPKWRGVRKYTPEDGGGPGLMTRTAGAGRLERYINAHLKKAKK